MLYHNQELPLEIRSRLSEAAQDLYLAYNCVIHWYGNPAKARKVAASAIKMYLIKNSIVPI